MAAVAGAGAPVDPVGLLVEQVRPLLDQYQAFPKNKP